MNYKIIEHPYSMFKDLPHLRYRVSKSSKRIYVEPFLGSGALFLNLPKKFDAYYVAEKHPFLYNIWNQLLFKTKQCGEFLIYAEFIEKTFGLYTLDGYDDYLTYYKTELAGTATREEAFGFILLSMHGRDNGQHTMSSKRIVNSYEYKRIEHTISHLRGISKKVSLHKHYEDVLYIPTSLQFINPPYYMDKDTKEWYARDTETLLKAIRPNVDVMYVDMKSPIVDKELEWCDDTEGNDLISGLGLFINSTRLASTRNKYLMYRKSHDPDEYLYSTF